MKKFNLIIKIIYVFSILFLIVITSFFAGKTAINFSDIYLQNPQITQKGSINLEEIRSLINFLKENKIIQ